MFIRMFTHYSVSFYNLHTLSKDHPKNTMPEGAKWIPYLRVEHLKNHIHTVWKMGVSFSLEHRLSQANLTMLFSELML